MVKLGAAFDRVGQCFDYELNILEVCFRPIPKPVDYPFAAGDPHVDRPVELGHEHLGGEVAVYNQRVSGAGGKSPAGVDVRRRCVRESFRSFGYRIDMIGRVIRPVDRLDAGVDQIDELGELGIRGRFMLNDVDVLKAVRRRDRQRSHVVGKAGEADPRSFTSVLFVIQEDDALIHPPYCSLIACLVPGDFLFTEEILFGFVDVSVYRVQIEQVVGPQLLVSNLEAERDAV